MLLKNRCGDTVKYFTFNNTKNFTKRCRVYFTPTS